MNYSTVIFRLLCLRPTNLWRQNTRPTTLIIIPEMIAYGYNRPTEKHFLRFDLYKYSFDTQVAGPVLWIEGLLKFYKLYEFDITYITYLKA